MPRESPVPPLDDRNDADDARAKPASGAEGRTTSGTRPAVQLEDKRTRRVSPFTMEMLARRPSMPPAEGPPADAAAADEDPSAGDRVTREAVPAAASATSAPVEAPAASVQVAPKRSGVARTRRAPRTTTVVAMAVLLAVAVVALAALWTRGILRLPGH